MPTDSGRRWRSSRRCRCTARAAGTCSVAPSVRRRRRSSPLAATPPPTASRSRPAALERALGAGDQAVDDRAPGRTPPGPPPVLARSLSRELAHLVQQRRLQAGEGEVEPLREGLARAPRRARARPRAGEGERLRVAFGGEALQRRPARVAEPEHPRALVERLAGGVVERAPEHVEAVVLGDVRAAACGRRSRSGTRTAARMALAGPSPPGSWPRRGPAGGRRPRTAARARRPAPWRSTARPAARRPAPGPAWPRPGRHRRGVAPGLLQRLRDDQVDELEVVARGDLRDHPAEARVRLLRGDHVGARGAPSPSTIAAQVSSQLRLQRQDPSITARRGWAHRRASPAASPACATSPARPRRCPGSSAGACPRRESPRVRTGGWRPRSSGAPRA